MWLYMILTFVLIILVLYLLAIMPKITNRHDLKSWQGKYYAHRGLHQNPKTAPENSLAAFRLAVEHNFGIEMDVQLSKDKIPVVFHDFNLKRVCGVNKKVRDLTFAELQELTLYDSKEQIPSFQSVLDMVNGQVPLIVEFKVEIFDTSVCKITAPMLEKYNGRYCIESFNPLVLLWYKRNRPNIMRGQLASNLIKDKEVGSATLYFILQNLLLNFITKPDFISYNYIHRKTLSLILCRRFYKVPTFAWTIKSQEGLEESRNSFDFFIFDHFIPQE
ncbi:glycerophosphodiester phosphodiesterase family protein [Anaerocolumna sp. MB42-C2]|uniref:glycerophosphodiester phosphodiesterase family protein n=1 Tax=Anaerocolumna sp. MB42-C2 TaxID=3070997 RepID=UPI0027E1B2D4|nr:glycerophosphodiester phosphodiesterase family protein [Anaerocolumna sp. MB42-C2]WMJ86006.1 glycerophosphodiester phosphodiesterase family protein [Anaerocolumna sp. MB42-C2]